MSQFLENIQFRIKTSSGNLLLFMARIFVGLVLGLTFSLIGQQIFSYGSLAFFFVIITGLVTFLRVSRGGKWTTLLVFSLICVLIGLLLQMYIQIAPGA